MPRVLTLALCCLALLGGCTEVHHHRYEQSAPAPEPEYNPPPQTTYDPPAPAPAAPQPVRTEIREDKESTTIIREGTEVRELPGDGNGNR